MSDRLKFDELNKLPLPIICRFIGGSEWPLYDIDVETGFMRIDVCGKLDKKHFVDVTHLTDADGIKHEADDFWHE